MNDKATHHSRLAGGWALGRPLITMMFTLVFSKLAKPPSDGVSYPILTTEWKQQVYLVVFGKDAQNKSFSAAELFA